MAEATGMAIAAQYIGAAAAGLASIHWSWWFSNAATAVYWPVSYVVGFLSTVLGSVLLVPLAFAGRVVLSIFSPALYVASFFLSISVGIVHFIVSLEVSSPTVLAATPRVMLTAHPSHCTSL